MDKVILEGRPHFIWIFPKMFLFTVIGILSFVAYFYFDSPFLKHFSLALLAISVVAELIIIIYYLSFGYKITEDRIIFRKGILNIRTKYIELYRIKDLEMFEPFIYRFFGLANIKMISSDRDTPVFILFAQKKDVEPLIRNVVEEIRKKKGVREIDTF